MKRIALIGTGQLGSRHLQGIAKLEEPFEIWLVDPDKEALSTAISRFEEIRSLNNYRGKILTAESSRQLHGNFNLAIFACNSFQRKQAIISFFENSNSSHLLLEKFLFPSLEDYDYINPLLNSKETKVWVNTPRRMYNSYRQLKEKITQTDNIQMTVFAGNLGLASNAIHYIDLFSFLTGLTDFEIKTDLLQKEIFESKRKGYIEFYGTITVTGQGNQLSITSIKSSSAPIGITIQSPDLKMLIQETQNPFMTLITDADNWQPSTSLFTMPFQSSLTNILVKDLFLNDKCNLPSYNESAKIHIALLKSFLAFYTRICDKTQIICPIT